MLNREWLYAISIGACDKKLSTTGYYCVETLSGAGLTGVGSLPLFYACDLQCTRAFSKLAPSAHDRGEDIVTASMCWLPEWS